MTASRILSKRVSRRKGANMTNQDILRIAMQQSAIDSSCCADDFLRQQNKIVISRNHAGARKYLSLPFDCDLTTYGHNIVASVSENVAEIAKAYIDRYPVEHCFETPNLHVFMQALKPFGLNICFMAEYFLPDVDVLRPLACAYPLKILYPDDLAAYYLPEWSNALCEKRKQLDILAVGAFDRQRLIGLAGCSADCDTMWQIGIDVLPEYRGYGVAAALVSTLAAMVLENGKVPFYCCAWSNIGSARTAIKSGFRPAWVQMTAKTDAFIAQINR